MSGESLEKNETAENALAEKINADSETSNEDKPKPMSDAQPGNNLVMAVEFEDGKDKETNGSATGDENTLTVNKDGENTGISDLNGDYMVKLHQNTSEDEDDEDDDLWEDHDDDSEEDNDETALDEDEASEEEETGGEDDEEDSEGDDEEIAPEKGEVCRKDAIEEANKEENAKVEKEIANKDERKAEEQSVEKVESNLKVNKSKGKREKNKVREESSKKLATGDRPKPSKRVESMGMIFMCSSSTKNDCFKYMVLGQSESKKNVVEKIYPGMRLFLYDVDLKLMYGIFKARERGGYNIEPKAFKSKFPSQVRFTVLADCLPLPEEKFRKVIKENYFTSKKFDCQLKSEQVKKLCKLFKSTSKGHQPKKLPRSRRAEKRPIQIHQEGSRKRRADDKRRRPEQQERIRHVERPRKRPRKAISPVARSRQPLPPSSSVPLIALDRNLNVDPYRRDVYLESRDRDPYRHDPYEGRQDRPIERRDPYLERPRESYRDGRDPYLDQRDPYRNGRDPHLDPRVSYTDTRELYPDRRVRYIDELDLYPDTRYPYKDDRTAYVERRVYMEEPYRRDPLLERRDVYGEDRREGVVYRDSYMSQGVLDRPLSLESRGRYDVVSQDPYVSYRALPALPSNAEPLYSSQYPSRSYRL